MRLPGSRQRTGAGGAAALPKCTAATPRIGKPRPRSRPSYVERATRIVPDTITSRRQEVAQDYTRDGCRYFDGGPECRGRQLVRPVRWNDSLLLETGGDDFADTEPSIELAVGIVADRGPGSPDVQAASLDVTNVREPRPHRRRASLPA